MQGGSSTTSREGGSLSHVAHCTARAIPTRLTAGPVRWVSVVACNSLDSRLLDADARDTSAIYRCGPFLFSHQIVFHAQLTSSTSCSRFFLWDFLKTFPWVSHNYNLLLLRNLQKAQSCQTRFGTGVRVMQVLFEMVGNFLIHPRNRGCCWEQLENLKCTIIV